MGKRLKCRQNTEKGVQNFGQENIKIKATSQIYLFDFLTYLFMILCLL